MKARMLAGVGFALIIVAVVLGVAGAFIQPRHMTSAMPAAAMNQGMMDGMMQPDASGGMMESSAMMGDHMMMMRGMMGGSMMGGSGSLFHLAPMLFWGGLLLLLVWGLLTYVLHPRPALALAPLTILQQRYASGEITPEQYEELRSRLDP